MAGYIQSYEENSEQFLVLQLTGTEENVNRIESELLNHEPRYWTWTTYFSEPRFSLGNSRSFDIRSSTLPSSPYEKIWRVWMFYLELQKIWCLKNLHHLTPQSDKRKVIVGILSHENDDFVYLDLLVK